MMNALDAQIPFEIVGLPEGLIPKETKPVEAGGKKRVRDNKDNKGGNDSG